MEPWGTAHEDLRFGYLLQLIQAVNRSKESTPILPPEHWFPTLRDEAGDEDLSDKIRGAMNAAAQQAEAIEEARKRR